MKQSWKEKGRREKVLLIAKLVFSILVLIAATLQLTHIWSNAIHVTVPLLGILQLLEAALSWNTNRDQAIMSLMVACFIAVVSFIVFFL